jgi:hypothetical protein
MNFLRNPKLTSLTYSATKQLRLMSSQLGDLGSGAGKGGGGGGSIREAGGAFGKSEAAKEEEYFYRKQREQLTKLKDDLKDEISFHEEQIKRHQDAINRHKQRVTDIDKKE